MVNDTDHDYEKGTRNMRTKIFNCIFSILMLLVAVWLCYAIYTWNGRAVLAAIVGLIMAFIGYVMTSPKFNERKDNEK